MNWKFYTIVFDTHSKTNLDRKIRYRYVVSIQSDKWKYPPMTYPFWHDNYYTCTILKRYNFADWFRRVLIRHGARESSLTRMQLCEKKKPHTIVYIYYLLTHCRIGCERRATCCENSFSSRLVFVYAKKTKQLCGCSNTVHNWSGVVHRCVNSSYDVLMPCSNRINLLCSLHSTLSSIK